MTDETATDATATDETATDATTTDGTASESAPTVVKIGGARAVDPQGALADVATLVDSSEDVVVVHGGSTAVDETLEALGEEPEYVETPGGVVGRFTDERTMEVFQMVMAGKLNTDLTASLQATGVDAVGLSGVDGGLLTGPRKSAVRIVEDGKRKIKRGDHSGRIDAVDDDLLRTLLDAGRTPVVTVPMLGTDGDDRVPVNADADRAAAAVAGALHADLVVLTDVDGVYADPDDPSTRIDTVATADDWTALESAAEGFMTKKVMAAEEALDGGAASVVVASANADDPVTSALDGDATTIHPSAIETDGDVATGDNADEDDDSDAEEDGSDDEDDGSDAEESAEVTAE